MDGALPTLEGFYEHVRKLIGDIDTAEGRQHVITELYENFFKRALPKTAESLGIAYTPIEVHDFINRSVDDLLREHFGASLSDEGVQIVDPFTGTGTFNASSTLTRRHVGVGACRDIRRDAPSARIFLGDHRLGEGRDPPTHATQRTDKSAKGQRCTICRLKDSVCRREPLLHDLGNDRCVCNHPGNIRWMSARRVEVERDRWRATVPERVAATAAVRERADARRLAALVLLVAVRLLASSSPRSPS